MKWMGWLEMTLLLLCQHLLRPLPSLPLFFSPSSENCSLKQSVLMWLSQWNNSQSVRSGDPKVAAAAVLFSLFFLYVAVLCTSRLFSGFCLVHFARSVHFSECGWDFVLASYSHQYLKWFTYPEERFIGLGSKVLVHGCLDLLFLCSG